MRILDIAMFVFMINLVAALIGPEGIDIFGGHAQLSSDSGIIKSVQELNETTTLHTYNASQPEIIDTGTDIYAGLVYTAKLALYGIVIIVKVMLFSVLVAPMLINTFGLPAALAIALNLIVIVVYGLGVVQWWSGKSTRDMQ